MTDRQGRTDLRGLYCVGEAAYTGLHGANRMASNSLLECLVYGASAARDIVDHIPSEVGHVENVLLGALVEGVQARLGSSFLETVSQPQGLLRRYSSSGHYTVDNLKIAERLLEVYLCEARL